MTHDTFFKAREIHSIMVDCATNVNTIEAIKHQLTLKDNNINKIKLVAEMCNGDMKAIEVPESFCTSFINELKDYYTETLQIATKEFNNL